MFGDALLSRRIFPFVLVAVGTVLYYIGAVNTAYAGLPQLQVAILEIVETEDMSKNERIVREVLNEIFPKLLERQFARGSKIYVWAELLRGVQADDELKRTQLFTAQRNRGVSLVLIPHLSFSSYGTVFMVELVDLRASEAVREGYRGVLELTTIGTKGDFDDIERRLDELARRTAKRVVEGRAVSRDIGRDSIVRASVLVWCIEPEDPLDRQLLTASRGLTLELPYFLSQRSMGTNIRVDFVGLNSRKFVYECLELRRGSRPRQMPEEFVYGERYDYLLSGRLVRVDQENLRLSLFLYSRNRKQQIPLGMYALPATIERVRMEKLTDSISEGFVGIALEGF